jgi:hypothetical protein
MKNIFTFGSFIGRLNEEKMGPWDPEAAKKSAAEIMKSRGGSEADKAKTGLAFPNIKKVFGREDYPLRFKIAQALALAGKDFFPTNSAFPDASKNRTTLSKGMFSTYYIGDADQNEEMKKFSEPLLKAIKPLVEKMEKDMSKYWTIESKSLPEVKQVKVAIDNIK